MSKQSQAARTITVAAHERRAPTRVIAVSAPSVAYEPPKPLLPNATSPMQCGEYDFSSTLDRATGTREYEDTIVDRCMGRGAQDSENDNDGEY